MKIHFIKQLLLIGAITISTFSLSHAADNLVIDSQSAVSKWGKLDNDRDISKLVSGWMYRDTAQWDKLQNIFTPDATIEVTWFEGKATDFINASKKMGTSKLSAKHLISNPVIEYHGDKAIAETDVMIVVHNDSIKLGSTVHARFYDQIKKVDNEWKISRRQVFYDFGSFNYPAGPVEIDQKIVEKFPVAYAPLGYLLNSGGYPVNRIFATKNSDAEKLIRKQGQAWLKK
jgi:hypothetical protein